MARIVFTPIRAAAGKAFRAQMMDIQQRMQEWADTARMSPKSKPYIADAVGKLATFLGSVLVANGATVPVGDATAVANGQDNGTATVTAGAISRVTLPSTDKIVKSTVKYLGPAPTGAWTNGYTFTIANGAITAIVLS